MARVRQLPTPGKVAEEMARVKRLGLRVVDLASAIESYFEEVHEGAYWSGGNGSSITPGGRGGGENRPTENVALSGPHSILRSQVRRASGVMRQLEPELERLESILREAYLNAYDPDMRERLKRMETLAREHEARRRRA